MEEHLLPVSHAAGLCLGLILLSLAVACELGLQKVGIV